MIVTYIIVSLLRFTYLVHVIHINRILPIIH